MNIEKLFKINETTSGEKDGGFIFQAEISHSVSFEIKNGEIVLSAGISLPFNKGNIGAKLHQVDLFPDLKTTEGTATLTYVRLSEVNILSRKFELAAEVIKRNIVNPSVRIKRKNYNISENTAIDVPESPEREGRAQEKEVITIFYKDEVERLETEGRLTRDKIKYLNQIFFKNTRYSVKLSTDHIFLREVSASDLNSGSPEITLKISTSLVDEAFGKKVGSFEKFKLAISGSYNGIINGREVAMFEIFDPIEKVKDKIFQTIIPSLILNFKSDQIPVETFTNKSSEIAASSKIDYDNLFNLHRTTSQEEYLLSDDDIVPPTRPMLTDEQKKMKKEKISVQIELLNQRIKEAEGQLRKIKDDRKKLEAEYTLSELKRKLEGAKNAYSSLGESLFIRQELALLESELNNFYSQYIPLFENK